MSNSSINRPELPENPKVKDINKYKKQLNWGDMPAFYHLVSSSVSELESLGAMGFDNALKRILNKHNWNLEALGGYIDDNNEVHADKKPRLALYQVFTERGFEIHCFPLAKNKEIDQYVRGHRLMEFNTWDPGTMRLLCRINQLHQFIAFYFQSGDKADRALIDYAGKLVHKVISYMQKHIDVVKVDGVTIEDFMKQQEKLLDDYDMDNLELGGLKGNNILIELSKDSDTKT
ncbi:hypothetical protein C2869_01450 [Saccharobesus litoralis]|uniref:Uncharacterized protein n=1 Tax=Saccharobesus litoralis TaxID=2172099 RepID=A0A2S0VLV2_9ALTE|nr:hypothetical protein [Saccharobesus litoralis]AWB65191.1 hypothetical protein C2869_01450 [Saccharobesus litoralis]